MRTAVLGGTDGRHRRRRRRAGRARRSTARPTRSSTGCARPSRTRPTAASGVAGTGATVEDYFRAVYDNFPYVLALIALITFLLLVRTFRSVLLPLKAVLLNLVSLAAVFGAVVFFWQHGHGSDAVFGVSPTGAITFWLPVIIFAFLFGLSMDYEVFILARMREEYDATGSTAQAVVTGLGRTGRLVTSAALILFFSFAALASSPGTDIKVLGTALGVGILIDATLVRALLVPALVSLFGRWNWWLPAGLAKVLRVAPVAARARPATEPGLPAPRRAPDDLALPVEGDGAAPGGQSSACSPRASRTSTAEHPQAARPAVQRRPRQVAQPAEEGQQQDQAQRRRHGRQHQHAEEVRP